MKDEVGTTTSKGTIVVKLEVEHSKHRNDDHVSKLLLCHFLKRYIWYFTCSRRNAKG